MECVCLLLYNNLKLGYLTNISKIKPWFEDLFFLVTLLYCTSVVRIFFFLFFWLRYQENKILLVKTWCAVLNNIFIGLPFQGSLQSVFSQATVTSSHPCNYLCKGLGFLVIFFFSCTKPLLFFGSWPFPGKT